MSSILKALRRSEEARAKDGVPQLMTRHDRVVRPRRRRNWPWIVTAALVLNALIVLLAFWPAPQPSPGRGGLNLESRAEATGARATVSVPRTRDPRLEGIGRARQSAEIELDVQASADSATQQAALPEPRQPSWLEDQPKSTPVPKEAPPVRAPKELSRVHRQLNATDFGQQALMDWVRDYVYAQEPAVEEKTVKLASVDPVKALPVEPVEPVEQETIPLAEPEPPAQSEPVAASSSYGDVPPLWKLPHAIRSQVPDVSLSVHVYTPGNANSFVIIDRKRYRAGDLVDGRVQLEAIIPTGVVMAYDGHRFKLGNQ